MRIFRSLDELLENLRGYELADITPSLSNSNASDFVNVHNLSAIVGAIPTRHIGRFFSQVSTLEEKLSKDALLELLALDTIPRDKKWPLFVAVAPRVCVGMRLEDVNSLRNLFPESARALMDIRRYPSFSITHSEDALGLLQFFVYGERPMGEVYEKIREANEHDLIADILSPGALEAIIEAGLNTRSKTAVARFLYQKLDSGRFLGEAVRSEDSFNSFLNVLGHLVFNAQSVLMNGLLEPQRLERLTPEMREQFARFMSHNVGASQLVCEDSLARRLYDNSLMSVDHFFLYCSRLRHYQDYATQFAQLNEQKKGEFYKYAITWLERARPSREEMKRYQEYQASCYALMHISRNLLVIFFGGHINDDDKKWWKEFRPQCALFLCMLIITPIVLAIAAILAIVGLIPALAGLCLQSQRTQAERAFKRAVDESYENDENVTADGLDSIYRNAHCFWNHWKTKDYLNETQTTRQSARQPVPAATLASASAI